MAKKIQSKRLKFRRAGCAASQKIRDTKPSVAAIGYAATRANMSCFPIRAIFARVITGDLRCAEVITGKGIPAVGKPAKNAERVLSRKCTSGMA